MVLWLQKDYFGNKDRLDELHLLMKIIIMTGTVSAQTSLSTLTSRVFVVDNGKQEANIVK